MVVCVFALALALLVVHTHAAQCVTVSTPTTSQIENSVVLTFLDTTTEEWTGATFNEFQVVVLKQLTGSATNKTYLNQCGIVAACTMNEWDSTIKNYTGNLQLVFFVVTAQGIYPGSVLLSYMLNPTTITQIGSSIAPLARPPTQATDASCAAPPSASAAVTQNQVNWSIVGPVIGAGLVVILATVLIVLLVHLYSKKNPTDMTYDPPKKKKKVAVQPDIPMATLKSASSPRRFLDLGNEPRDVDVDRDSLNTSFASPQHTSFSSAGVGLSTSFNSMTSPGLYAGASPIRPIYVVQPDQYAMLGVHPGFANNNYVIMPPAPRRFAPFGDVVSPLHGGNSYPPEQLYSSAYAGSAYPSDPEYMMPSPRMGNQASFSSRTQASYQGPFKSSVAHEYAAVAPVFDPAEYAEQSTQL